MVEARQRGGQGLPPVCRCSFGPPKGPDTEPVRPSWADKDLIKRLFTREQIQGQGVPAQPRGHRCNLGQVLQTSTCSEPLSWYWS